MPSLKPTALVAEDDRAMADIIRLALTRAGFEVTVANDGKRALQYIAANRYDVISSDYQMPGANGETLLRAVRAGGPSQDAMLLLCSAKSYELDSERLRSELRLAAIFYKPFSLAELVTTALGSVQLPANV